MLTQHALLLAFASSALGVPLSARYEAELQCGEQRYLPSKYNCFQVDARGIPVGALPATPRPCEVIPSSLVGAAATAPAPALPLPRQFPPSGPKLPLAPAPAPLIGNAPLPNVGTAPRPNLGAINPNQFPQLLGQAPGRTLGSGQGGAASLGQAPGPSMMPGQSNTATLSKRAANIMRLAPILAQGPTFPCGPDFYLDSDFCCRDGQLVDRALAGRAPAVIAKIPDPSNPYGAPAASIYGGTAAPPKEVTTPPAPPAANAPVDLPSDFSALPGQEAGASPGDLSNPGSPLTGATGNDNKLPVSPSAGLPTEAGPAASDAEDYSALMAGGGGGNNAKIPPSALLSAGGAGGADGDAGAAVPPTPGSDAAANFAGGAEADKNSGAAGALPGTPIVVPGNGGVASLGGDSPATPIVPGVAPSPPAALPNGVLSPFAATTGQPDPAAAFVRYKVPANGPADAAGAADPELDGGAATTDPAGVPPTTGGAASGGVPLPADFDLGDNPQLPATGGAATLGSEIDPKAGAAPADPKAATAAADLKTAAAPADPKAAAAATDPKTAAAAADPKAATAAADPTAADLKATGADPTADVSAGEAGFPPLPDGFEGAATAGGDGSNGAVTDPAANPATSPATNPAANPATAAGTPGTPDNTDAGTGNADAGAGAGAGAAAAADANKLPSAANRPALGNLPRL